nr:Gag-Pol polyprotein [Tanacetum cinerariifolium]
MSKAKERCMVYFRSLHSYLQVISKEDLKGTRIKHGFKRAFMSLFGQDVDTFTITMFLKVDRLQKQFDKDEFQEDGSMIAFWVQNRSEVQDDNNRLGNDTDADDADIRPIYDEEPMAEEVNSRAEIQSQKTRAINKPVDQKRHTQKPDRQIFTSHRWIPTGKLFDSCTSKVHSEPTHGSNVDIPNIHESKQTLDLSVGTSINLQKEQSLDFSADTLCNVNKENLRFKPRTTMSTKVPTTDMISMMMMIELESLFGPSFDEYLNGEDQVVSKPSAVTTTDTSDKCQQQPDSNSSTTTLATTVTADGNFNFTPIQEQRETSSRNVDSLNMHTFYRQHHSEHRWIKDHPLEQVIGNPSQSIRTRRQLETDSEMSKGYSQKEGIDFEESFAPIALWKLSGYSFRMLYKNLSNPYHPDHVYRLKKELYGLKQAPRA